MARARNRTTSFRFLSNTTIGTLLFSSFSYKEKLKEEMEETETKTTIFGEKKNSFLRLRDKSTHSAEVQPRASTHYHFVTLHTIHVLDTSEIIRKCFKIRSTYYKNAFLKYFKHFENNLVIHFIIIPLTIAFLKIWEIGINSEIFSNPLKKIDS